MWLQLTGFRILIPTRNYHHTSVVIDCVLPLLPIHVERIVHVEANIVKASSRQKLIVIIETRRDGDNVIPPQSQVGVVCNHPRWHIRILQGGFCALNVIPVLTRTVRNSPNSITLVLPYCGTLKEHQKWLTLPVEDYVREP